MVVSVVTLVHNGRALPVRLVQPVNVPLKLVAFGVFSNKCSGMLSSLTQSANKPSKFFALVQFANA